MMEPPKGKNQIMRPQRIFLPMDQSCLIRLRNAKTANNRYITPKMVREPSERRPLPQEVRRTEVSRLSRRASEGIRLRREESSCILGWGKR